MSLSSNQRSETTLGTDPWASSGDHLFDRTDWVDREENLRQMIESFEKTLERLDGDGGDNERWRKVVERLEQRIYSLEDQLRDKEARCEEAVKRIDALTKELNVWKQSEPSP